jgi:branched-chain amino acid transport system permease protein
MRSRFYLVWAGVAAASWFIPQLVEALGGGIFYLVFLYGLLFWVAQATSWNMLSGFAGYFSFGQGAFFGAGVYTTAVLSARLGWPLLAAMAAGAVTAAAIAAFMGVVVFRLRILKGEIFALVTLAVAFVLASVARLVKFIDGGQGVSVTSLRLPEFFGDFSTSVYRAGALVAVLAVGLAAWIQRSRFGLGLSGIRDDEEVAEGLGVPTFRYKMIILTLSSALSGLSGALHALQIGYVTVDDVFNIRVPLFVILMSILGGTRHWMGPVVGAAVIHTLTDRLSAFGAENMNQIFLGLLLVVVVAALREGVYRRLVARRWVVLATFVATLALLAVTGWGGRLITQAGIAFGMAILVSLLPARLGSTVPAPREVT